MQPFKKRAFKKRAPKRAKKYVRKPKVGVAVKKYVKQAIHANVENKRAITDNGFAVGSIANSATLYARPITPWGAPYLNIVQGLGQGDRIGNKCKTLKAMMRYTLSPLSYDLTTNPLPTPTEFMIIIGFVKSTPTAIPTAAQIGSIFQNGSTSAGPAGDLGDLIQPFNTDTFTIKKVIRHKIGNSDYSGTGSQNNSQRYANNDFKLNAVRALNITNIYPKTLTFSDAGAQIQNAGLYVMCQAVKADNTTSNALYTYVNFNYTIDLTYEDA